MDAIPPSRVATGIPGMDEMIQGGLEKNSSVLVAGTCGTGKTTFCMQYIYNGAIQFNEPGVYVSFEEKTEKLRKHMLNYGWDLKALEDQGKVRILRIAPKEVMHIIKEEYGEILNAINDIQAKRVVIDSVSSIEIMIDNEFDRKENAIKLCEWLSGHDCTSLIISESEQGTVQYTRHGIMEFVVDGIIVLYNIRKGNTRVNALEVLKMRGTKHDKSLVPFNIDRGLTVYPQEQVFTE
ncbi:MAG: AAA family ATPase [Candidatus Altiarchaeota archaeon]|nr:AAA family ATPase [Candidatus Altiarchaeota archaeon]